MSVSYAIPVNELCNLGYNNIVLGFESALSYYELSNQNYFTNPIIISDKLPEGVVLGKRPTFIGVKCYPKLDTTCYPGVMVVPWHIALCDVMERNKYSEDILQALYEVRDAEEKMEMLRKEAESRNIIELLEWELSEIDGYYSY